MFGLKITDDYFHQLHDAEIPCVTVDTLVRGRNVGCVTIDNVLAFQELTQYLFDLGHRELLLITGRKTAAVTMERMAGAYEAYLANNFEFRKENVVYCDFREDEAYRKTKLYLKRSKKRGDGFSLYERYDGCRRTAGREGVRISGAGGFLRRGL